ncbi:acyl carrier protein [Amycolatopsis sp. NBC_01488]|uniref:acyl carrier protein n=1 Tax=Amycolatopsis sp. NBC_01488 TaxID=2903563 RepID=UPI002E2B2CFA|nr:acyl carrier protein [Amycolatopsis sp. NBC_01488]
MTALVLQRLTELMVQCGDRDPAVDVALDDSIGDLSFEELGFDSLSLFNMCLQIENTYPVRLALDDVLAAETPNGLIDLVNENLSRSA